MVIEKKIFVVFYINNICIVLKFFWFLIMIYILVFFICNVLVLLLLFVFGYLFFDRIDMVVLLVK